MKLFFAPLPGRYAAIRIDPLGTVERYDYPDIEKAAREIPTKTYLVFLKMNLNLPVPGRPWHAFDCVLISPSLPPPDEERAATPAMCTPISPNTTHPEGREPLETMGVFPYDNCYHWSDDSLRMDVRIRARPERFDDDVAIKLTPSSREKLGWYMGQDFARMRQTRAERHSEAQPLSVLAEQPSSGTLEDAPVIGDQGANTASERMNSPEHHMDAEHDSTSEMNGARSSATSHDTTSDHESVTLGEVIQDVLNAGIFGNYGEDQEIYPLVDLWFDLSATLKQEDIPNPKELFKERDAVVELIMEGRRRHKEEAARRVREQEAAGDLYVAEPETHAEPEGNAKRRKFRPVKALRRVRGGLKAMMARILYLTRPPYLLMWP